MKTFEPIFFGDDNYGHNRFLAIEKEGYIFVADAARYDYDHKDRATVVWYGKMEDVESIDKLIENFLADHWEYAEEKYRGWMMELGKIDLILLNKAYMGKIFSESIDL